MPDDFLEHMSLDDLSRFVKDLCRKVDVTEEEVQRLGRMSSAELSHYLREHEAKMRRWREGRTDG